MSKNAGKEAHRVEHGGVEKGAVGGGGDGWWKQAKEGEK